MVKSKPDKEPAFKPDVDRRESVALMEPLLFAFDSRHRHELLELSFELGQKSASLRSALPSSLIAPLADLVRAMNCYYSNLIEGHNTHPVDIERALKGDYSHDSAKRELQREAVSHMAVQAWIDGGGLKDACLSISGIQEVHRRFCEQMPDKLLSVTDRKGNCLPIIGGEFRRYDVQVGRHISISAGAIPRFMERFEAAYSRLGKPESVLSAAAAHHRLLWIHPFIDGNGRVARLMSHAQLLDALDTGGVWSIARGLARNEDRYKQCLMDCDSKRRNDLDGRGHFSEEALAVFTRFFLETCIDQVDFMEGLMQPAVLRERIVGWAKEEIANKNLPIKSEQILEALLYRGELPRHDIPRVLSIGERQGNRVVAALMKHGVVTASTHRAPLRLSFPAALASKWMPGLFPQALASTRE